MKKIFSPFVVFVLLIAIVSACKTDSNKSTKNGSKMESQTSNEKYYQLVLIWVKDPQKFQEYVVKAMPIVEKYGGELDRMFEPTSIYADGVEQPHIVNLVHYDSKEAYEKMNGDHEFRKIVHLRDESIEMKSFEGYLSKNTPSVKLDTNKIYNIEIANYKDGDPMLYSLYEKEGESAMAKYGYNVEFKMEIDKTASSRHDFVKISYWESQSGHKDFETDDMHSKIENELYPPAVNNLIWITAKTHPTVLAE